MKKTHQRPRKPLRGRPPLAPEKRKKALPIMFDPDQMAAIKAMAIDEGITKGEAVRMLVGEALAVRETRQQRRGK